MQANMLTRKETVQIIKKKQYKLLIFQLIAMEFDWEILHLYYTIRVNLLINTQGAWWF